jgi:hypothetical protein
MRHRLLCTRAEEYQCHTAEQLQRPHARKIAQRAEQREQMMDTGNASDKGTHMNKQVGNQITLRKHQRPLLLPMIAKAWATTARDRTKQVPEGNQSTSKIEQLMILGPVAWMILGPVPERQKGSRWH